MRTSEALRVARAHTQPEGGARTEQLLRAGGLSLRCGGTSFLKSKKEKGVQLHASWPATRRLALRRPSRAVRCRSDLSQGKCYRLQTANSAPSQRSARGLRKDQVRTAENLRRGPRLCQAQVASPLVSSSRGAIPAPIFLGKIPPLPPAAQHLLPHCPHQPACRMGPLSVLPPKPNLSQKGGAQWASQWQFFLLLHTFQGRGGSSVRDTVQPGQKLVSEPSLGTVAMQRPCGQSLPAPVEPDSVNVW